LVSPVVSLPQVSPPKPCTRLSSSPSEQHARPSYSSRCYHPHNSRWGVNIMEFLIMKVFTHPCYLVPLRHKYSPQHPIFKRCQTTLLSEIAVENYRTEADATSFMFVW
jgi:hypothetical protein